MPIGHAHRHWTPATPRGVGAITRSLSLQGFGSPAGAVSPVRDATRICGELGKFIVTLDKRSECGEEAAAVDMMNLLHMFMMWLHQMGLMPPMNMMPMMNMPM